MNKRNGLISMYGTDKFGTISVVGGEHKLIRDGIVAEKLVLSDRDEALQRATILLQKSGVNGAIYVVEQQPTRDSGRIADHIARFPADRIPNYNALRFVPCGMAGE